MEKMIKITHEGIQVVKPKPQLVDSKNPILRRSMPYFDFEKYGNKNRAIEIANDLIEVLRETKAYGLAAPQIGIEANVFVMGVDENIVAYFNPVLEPIGNEKTKAEEGCLSFPHLFLNIERYKSIKLQYQDYIGKSHTVRFDDTTARIAQHETQHLAGICFDTLVGKTSLMMAKERQRKLIKSIERKQIMVAR